MMQDEHSIAQNLLDAGCGAEEIEAIMGCWRKARKSCPEDDFLPGPRRAS